MIKQIKKLFQGHTAREQAVIELTRTESSLLRVLSLLEEDKAAVQCYEARIARLNAYLHAATEPR
jgi:hypothetical protein